MGLYSKTLPLLNDIKSLVYYQSEEEAYEQLLNNCWRPQLAVIGQQGLQTKESAGNAIYKEITFRCSMRLPPTLKGDEAEKILRKIIFEDRSQKDGIDFTFGA